MDSYHFSRVTGRPASQSLSESHTGDYLPQMSTYSGSSQSRNTSVPQPIDFGGSTSRYTGSSQSRCTSIPDSPFKGYKGYVYHPSVYEDNGVSQSRRTSTPLIEYRGSVSGDNGSSQSRRTSTPQTESRSSVSGDNGSSQSRGTSIPDSPFKGYVASYRYTPSDCSDFGCSFPGAGDCPRHPK